MSVTTNRPRTFNEAVYAHIAQRPQAEALRFLPEGEGEGVVLTYQQLHDRAAALAALLQSHGARGERVMLASHDNIAFTVGFLACLYSGAVVVPVPMLDPKRPGPALHRLQAIAADAKARFFLTNTLPKEQLDNILGSAPDLARLIWVRTDDTSCTTAQWQMPDLEPSSLAFLQYTSGSTGAPKGVMVTQGNLLANSEQIRKGWGNHERSVFVSWLPQFHDFGLIFIALQSLYLGTLLVSMPPAAFVKQPLRFLRALSQYRATVSAAPNFAFDLCVAKTTLQDRAGLDFSAMETFANGAEPVRAEGMRHFVDTFSAYGLRRDALSPAYGLAEATVYVSAWQRAEIKTLRIDEQALGRGRVSTDIRDPKKVVEVVACGPPGDGIHVAIVDPDSGAARDRDEVGEIWVRGDNVSAGYFERPQESRENFGWMLGELGPYLRTGDMGFIHEGSLYITGRRKDLIIIRGVNHYPQDFEATMEQAHPNVRTGFTAAFGLESEGEERLILVAEVVESTPGSSDKTATPQAYSEMVEAIRTAIAMRHEIAPLRIALLPRGTIPKTSSGKIQRRQCKQFLLNNALDVLFEETFGRKQVSQAMEPSQSTSPKYRAIEQYVVELLKLQRSDLDSGKNLAAYGFDSIDGANLSQKIQKDWGIDVALELIPAMTVKELVETIAG